MDIPQMIPLLNELDRLHLEWYPDRFRRLPGGTRTPHMVTDMFKHAAFQVYVAVDAGTVMGMMALEYRERSGPIAVREHYILVDMIVVGEEHRRKGVGSQLLVYAEELAKESKNRRLELKVYKKNEAARRWYEQQGFEPVFETLARDVQVDGEGK